MNHTGARTHFSYPEGCCSVHESTPCRDRHVLSKQHFVHGSTFARRHLLSKQYLRVASDRILCARKHLCSKARTVLAVLYVRLKGRHFSSEGLVQTALVLKVTRDTRGASLCLTSLGQTRPVRKKPNPTGTRAFQSCAASILSPRHILTTSSNKECPGNDPGNQVRAPMEL